LKSDILLRLGGVSSVPIADIGTRLALYEVSQDRCADGGIQCSADTN